MNITLSTQERVFYQKVTASVFSNPFSIQREALDKDLSGIAHNLPLDDHRESSITKIDQKINVLVKQKKDSLQFFTGLDKDIMKYVFLFEVFHKFLKHFDDHILIQMKCCDKLIKVSFAADAIKMLQTKGFTTQEARWFFAAFFQLRRAYYFINLEIIGCSDSMRQLRSSLWENIFSNDMLKYEKFLFNRMEDFSTLLLGETGTGKGVSARAIGMSGFIPLDNNDYFKTNFITAFISINLSEYSTSLIESELFGHKKGSFTGANEDRNSILSKCNQYGAIFLDEIGELSIDIQIKLLKVLQERIYTPVGSREQKRFSGRVIAATNKSIHKLRQTKLFRDDFYYRLCSDIIHVPSLKDRISENSKELEELIIYITKKITNTESTTLTNYIFTTLLAQIDKHYHWSGNVRELEQAVRRILLKGEYKGDICLTNAENDFIHCIEDGKLTATQLLSHYCSKLYQKHKTLEAVAQLTELDRRTVKKYINYNG